MNHHPIYAAPSSGVSNLQRLRAATEEILRSLKTEECPDDPINWGDLHCVEARLIVSDSGREYLQVMISEASPSCNRLREIVRGRLGIEEWKDVSVVTEW